MLTELLLVFLISLVPMLMYGGTVAALRLGPNRWIGFRISPRMQDPAMWRRIHQHLLGGLRRALPLSLVGVPMLLVLFASPDAFGPVMLAGLAVMLVFVSAVTYRAFRLLEQG